MEACRDERRGSLERGAYLTVPCTVYRPAASELKGRCGGRTKGAVCASELELGLDRHRPRELGQERLGEGLVDGHIVPLAPGDGDARVVVVDLGGTERDVLETVLGGEAWGLGVLGGEWLGLGLGSGARVRVRVGVRGMIMMTHMIIYSPRPYYGCVYLHLHVLLGLVDALLELARLGGILLLLDRLELGLR